jgi:hypothetical protein
MTSAGTVLPPTNPEVSDFSHVDMDLGIDVGRDFS